MSSQLDIAVESAGYLPPDLNVSDPGAVYEHWLYLSAKRFIDIVLTLALMPIALPVLLLIALAVKLSSRGPVFFRQLRAGKNGRPFWCLKFRSMVVGAEAGRGSVEHLNQTHGPTFKVPDDPRVTRLGRFLRRSSLDELPQLLHVLTGRMSLVGPRPLPLNEIRNVLPAERIRLRVKPGLTGLWQVSGRSEIPYNEWVELDAYYARYRSTLLDLQILLQTLPAVLSARGAY
jgi:lipopolysaccharide/colanic/teichoic acid biosynthesis glycosyltransferase